MCPSQKVTIEIAKVDLTMILLLKGAGEMDNFNLIYEEYLWGNGKFEFELGYKYLTLLHNWTLYFLRNCYVLLCLKI